MSKEKRLVSETFGLPKELSPSDVFLERNKLIDWKGCLQMYSGDENRVRLLLGMLSDDLLKTVETLGKLYPIKDIKAIRIELHRTLAGVVYLCLPKLEDALKDFQKAVKTEPSDFDEWQRTYENLIHIIEEFRQNCSEGQYQ